MNLATEYQEQLLAVVPKFTAAFGFPASILLMSEVVIAHQRGKGGNALLRSLAWCAFFLCLDALGWFLSTWAVPEGDFAFSAGNVTTCEFQGFLLQVVIGAPLSCCAMTFYFYFIVTHDKTPEDLVRYERWVSPLIALYAFGSAFFLLGMDQYNHIGAVCWVQGSPPSCENSSYHENPDIECERGNWAWLYGMVMFYIPIWISIFLIICLNILIYAKLRNEDNGDAKWFAKQSFLYALAFFFTWAPSTTWSGMHWTADGGNFVVDILAAFFEPLGGLWNLLIFLRDRPASRNRVLRLVCCEYCEPPDADEEEHDDAVPKHKKHGSQTQKDTSLDLEALAEHVRIGGPGSRALKDDESITGSDKEESQ